MSNQVIGQHKSSIGGMDANIMALLTYIASVVVSWIPYLGYVAWLVPLVFFFMEKESKFVKFHAMQSFVLHAISAALRFIVSVIIGGIVSASINNVYDVYSSLGIMGVIGFISLVISIVITVFAIIAIVNAYGYKAYHIPLVGGIAEKLSGKLEQK